MTTETIASDPTPPVEPAIAATAVTPPVDPSIVVDPAAAVDPVTVDPTAATDGEPKPHGNKGKTPWWLGRISEESERARRAEERAQVAEDLLQRVRTNPDPATPATTPPADESAIERRARQIAQETINGEKIRTVIQNGIGKFTDWDDRMATLGAAGAATPEFALDVVSVDPVNAHEILHQLADDPQKASRLARMDTRTRTIELVKMSMAAQGKTAAPAVTEKPVVPASKTVSRAPAPPPSIEPGATALIDWRTDPNISDDEWSKHWDENQKKRGAARR